MYELTIVGGGPAGAAAAVYAARKHLKTALITEEWGGQSAVSSDIQNWIGIPSISGTKLADALHAHVEYYKNNMVNIIAPARASGIELRDSSVIVNLASKPSVETRALLVASGARRRHLEIPGAAQYEQKGLTYCASCDGPLFEGKDVAVIGGGNAGFETALQLLAYCKSVTLLHRRESFKADAIIVNATLAHENMRAIANAEPTAIIGEQFVTGVRWKNTVSGEEKFLSVEGIFVEIGLLPNTEWLRTCVEMNDVGQIKVDPRRQRTSHPRIWAAGDCSDGLYHQNNIAAGDAIKALEDIYMTLRRS